MNARCGAPPVSREPKTTSAWPSAIGATRRGMSLGSYSRSASWMTQISPPARAIAARSAAPLPRFGWRTTTVSGCAARQPARIAGVASVEPSSTTTISGSSGSAATRSSTRSSVAASLYAGIRTDTRKRLTV